MKSSVPILDVPFIDITEYADRKLIEDKKCMWPLDNIHDKIVAVAKMFDGKLVLPICERHLTWHRSIVTLFGALISEGYNRDQAIDKVLDMDREVVMSELIKRGLIPTKQ